MTGAFEAGINSSGFVIESDTQYPPATSPIPIVTQMNEIAGRPL